MSPSSLLHPNDFCLPSISTRRSPHAAANKKSEPATSLSFAEADASQDTNSLNNTFSHIQPSQHFRQFRARTKGKYESTRKENLEYKLGIVEEEKKKIPQFDTKILETWMNNTLKEYKLSSLPRQIANDETKTPLSCFGIDRGKLTVIYIYISLGLRNDR